MKTADSLLAAFAVLVAIPGMAQSYSHLYKDLPVELEQVKDVVVPEYRVNLLDFGADPSGNLICTTAFETALSKLEENGGGHLDVPAGTYLCSPIQLKSNMDLHLEKGCTLLFTTDKSLFIGKGTSNALPCIRARKATNVCITGEGVINGQGEYWRPVKKKKASAEEWAWCLSLGGTLEKEDTWLPFNLNNGIPNIAESAQAQEEMRYHLVQITDCSNVLIKGVTLRNSPKFHLVPTRCKNLIIDGITVDCPWNAQNGDAIDPGNVQTALITGCTISCGDDGICMKGGVGADGVAAGPNSDFLIQDNTVYRAHGGFVIGSEFSGGMHRIVVRNCVFDGTDIGLRFKSAPGRGGTCSDIYCSNIKMNKIRNEAISFVTGYADKGAVVSATAKDDKSAYFPDFCNVRISNVEVNGAKTAMLITGMAGHPVHDITLVDVIMMNCKNGLKLKYAERIRLVNTLIQSQKPDEIDDRTCTVRRR